MVSLLIRSLNIALVSAKFNLVSIRVLKIAALLALYFRSIAAC